MSIKTLLVLLGVCVAAQAQNAKPSVVLISLDGFPAAALEDPKTPVPTLHKLIREGTWARRMTTINPTVTWPNHTAMVTGVNASRHGLLVNGAIVRTGTWPPVKIDPMIPKVQMVHVPTVYDAAFKAGLGTAQVDWVAIEKAPTIRWEFPEIPAVDGTVEREMIGRGITDAATVQQFRQQNIFRRDEVWTDAAAHILRAHQPNLLLFHLLALDTTHHTYGPGSLAAAGAMAFLDSCVARVIEAVRAAGMESRTSVIVVSDHGFKAVRNPIDVRPAIAAAGLADEVHVVPEGGYELLYTKPEKRAETVSKVRKILGGIEGIAEVAGPERFAALGLPTSDPQMADLFLVPKTGYAFAASKGGAVSTPVASASGAHGYLNSDPEMDAIFIAWGPGIRSGVVLDRVRNIDVAPTIAQLLGIRMEGAIEGRPIRDALK